MLVHPYLPQQQKKIEVREVVEQLSDKTGDLFHLLVTELLFIMKRCRPYLEKDVGFLTNRLSKSDVDVCEKLQRVLRFVHCTLKEKMAFGATNLNTIFT